MNVMNITRRLHTVKYIAIFFIQCILFSLSAGNVYASFTNVFGVSYVPAGSGAPSTAQYCMPGEIASAPSGTTLWFVPTCTLTVSSDNYVPVSGNYAMVTEVGDAELGTNFAKLVSTKPLSQQSVTFSASAKSGVLGSGNVCFYLYSSGGSYYKFNGFDYSGCKHKNRPPIPPDPPPPPSSCTINGGNTLNVSLGNIDRATAPTVPGTGSSRHIQIPIECTGSVATIPVIMTLSFTPITIGSDQIVKSSANGLGVSITYNDSPLSTSDTTAIDLIPGSNELELGFEAIRDPNVAVGDVPTGAFNASATMILTQQ